MPILIPTIELAPPESWDSLDQALRMPGGVDWLIFTSANAVQAFAERARLLESEPNPEQIAVIGPATAKAVRELLGREADLVPGRYVAESLLEALLPKVNGASVLLVRAAVASDLLPDGLAAAGARVAIAEAYRNVIPEGSIEALGAHFRGQPIDAILFTSASTARNLADLMERAKLTLPAGIVLASIGPVTSGAMRELGWAPTAEAEQATLSSLVTCLSQVL